MRAVFVSVCTLTAVLETRSHWSPKIPGRVMSDEAISHSPCHRILV